VVSRYGVEETMKRIFAGFLTLLMAVAGMNCYGGFVLTKKINNWNGGLENKWVKSIVNVPICIFVYGITGLLDVVVFNLLEFWTGSNPLAMKEGESETQIVHREGREYQVIATKNQFEIREIANGKQGKPTYLTFRPNESAWYVTQDGKTVKASEATELTQGEVKLFHPDGHSVDVKL
jgi:hypothetical protein